MRVPPSLARAAAAVTVAAACAALIVSLEPGRAERDAPARGEPSAERPPATAERPSSERPERRHEEGGGRADPREPRIAWRDSRSLGSTSAGRLVRGVRLPASGKRFFTWDPILRRSPGRPWRRWGNDRLVRMLLDVLRGYARDHPRAGRVAIGDLSRPRGGDFGPRYGLPGHASHQNGLDADLYYPRLDRRERAARTVAQVDLRLAQELVDRFVRAGADKVFVGPATGLTGPPGVVQAIPNHDTHLHVRIGPGG